MITSVTSLHSFKEAMPEVTQFIETHVQFKKVCHVPGGDVTQFKEIIQRKCHAMSHNLKKLYYAQVILQQ